MYVAITPPYLEIVVCNLLPGYTWIQYTHLAQMHFRLTKTRLNTLFVIIFKTLNK